MKRKILVSVLAMMLVLSFMPTMSFGNEVAEEPATLETEVEEATEEAVAGEPVEAPMVETQEEAVAGEPVEAVAEAPVEAQAIQAPPLSLAYFRISTESGTVSLDEAKPYFNQNTMEAVETGTLGENGITAYFDAVEEIVYLQDFSAEVITMYAPVTETMTINLAGNNSLTKSNSDGEGISPNQPLVINGKGTLNINNENGLGGIYNNNDPVTIIDATINSVSRMDTILANEILLQGATYNGVLKPQDGETANGIISADKLTLTDGAKVNITIDERAYNGVQGEKVEILNGSTLDVKMVGERAVGIYSTEKMTLAGGSQVVLDVTATMEAQNLENAISLGGTIADPGIGILSKEGGPAMDGDCLLDITTNYRALSGEATVGAGTVGTVRTWSDASMAIVAAKFLTTVTTPITRTLDGYDVKAYDIYFTYKGETATTNGPMTVSVDLGDMKTDALSLFHEKSDGTLEPVNYAVNGSVVTFTNSDFSPYLFANKVSASPGDVSPNTGDNNNLGIGVLLLLVGAGMVMLNRKVWTR